MRTGLEKSGLQNYNGVKLVNKALNTNIGETILKISDEPDEHEGICHICRGLVLSFRNPTHHRIVESITRENAIKVCAFIDELLNLIDKTEIKKNV